MLQLNERTIAIKMYCIEEKRELYNATIENREQRDWSYNII